MYDALAGTPIYYLLLHVSLLLLLLIVLVTFPSCTSWVFSWLTYLYLIQQYILVGSITTSQLSAQLIYADAGCWMVVCIMQVHSGQGFLTRYSFLWHGILFPLSISKFHKTCSMFYWNHVPESKRNANINDSFHFFKVY